MQIRTFAPADQDDVIALWDLCGLTRPWNDPRKDIARKLRVQPELFLVAVDGGELVGSVMAGNDGHRAWLYYLAVAPSRQREGIGGKMVAEAERLVMEMGCPKLNLQVRKENLGVGRFYETLGFNADDVISFSRRLEHDA